MVENVFADVPSEGATLDIDKAFERLETKETTTFSESQPEKKETEKVAQIETEAKPEPFHKHPRWIKTQQELKEAREKLSKLESEKQPTIELPKWYIDRYGDTEESKKNYQSIVQKDGELDWLKGQIKEELQRETQAETQTIKDGEEYVNTQIQEMTDEGLKFERNTLLKFMVDFQAEFGAGALLDAEGNYDFRKSLTLMEKMAPKEEDTSTDTKKQLAAIGRGKSSAQRSSTVPVLSRKALRGGNWRDAETGQFTK